MAVDLPSNGGVKVRTIITSIGIAIAYGIALMSAIHGLWWLAGLIAAATTIALVSLPPSTTPPKRAAFAAVILASLVVSIAQ
jgi:hypothetical protein